MTALAQDRKTDKLGVESDVYPVLLKYPVEASTSIYGGALVAINAAGNAVPASAVGALKCIGRAERQCLNLATGGTVSPDGIANGNAGSILVPVRQGVFYFNINADSTITKANFGANVFASDDNTVSLSDAGGTRPYAGFIVDPQQTASLGNMNPNTTQVGVFVGVANPYAANPEIPGSSAGQFKARAVVTSLQAYTGSGTNVLTQTTLASGWQTQDGVTNAVGDVVFIQAGTTNLTAALDSGPWVVTTLGSASVKWVLTRPDWWTNGSVMPVGAVIDLGGEGTLWAGTAWKSFATQGSAVVGTNDPAFYVGRVTQTAVLSSGTIAVANVGVRSLAKSQFLASLNTNGGTLTGTVGYGVLPNVTALVAGYIGTASITFKAIATAQAVQSSDASTINCTIINW